MFFDLRPVNYPMVIVNSHEVAEQISRVSKQFAWSAPKSPTMNALVRVIGRESILTRQVGVHNIFSNTVPARPKSMY